MLKETAAPLNGVFELKFLKNDFKGNIVNPYFLSISKTKIIILLYIPPHTTTFLRFVIFAPADATSPTTVRHLPHASRTRGHLLSVKHNTKQTNKWLSKTTCLGCSNRVFSTGFWPISRNGYKVNKKIKVAKVCPH